MTHLNDGLGSICGGDGAIRVLAIDHRDSLRAVVGQATDADLIALKADLVASAAGVASGVMLDPAYGMQPSVLGRVPAGVGIIAALEAQGYLADSSVTHTTLMDGWDSMQARAAGARAAKFLALWDGKPDHDQLSTIGDARRDAHNAGLPLVLEPLPRGFDPYGPWVVEWVRVHAPLGADLYKLPFPGSVAACREVTNVLDRPWTVLSAGADFETFVDQLETAADAGAAGYIVGRAVWREAATIDRERRRAAIADVVVPRLSQLASLPLPPAVGP